MNEYDIKRLALVLAVQAEIEGMKAENDHYKVVARGVAYSERQFFNKAEQLRELAYKPNEQL